MSRFSRQEVYRFAKGLARFSSVVMLSTFGAALVMDNKYLMGVAVGCLVVTVVSLIVMHRNRVVADDSETPELSQLQAAVRQLAEATNQLEDATAQLRIELNKEYGEDQIELARGEIRMMLGLYGEMDNQQIFSRMSLTRAARLTYGCMLVALGRMVFAGELLVSNDGKYRVALPRRTEETR